MVAEMPSHTAEETAENGVEAPEQPPNILTAEEYVAMGKRHMLLGEFNIALEHLANACQKL